jgi:hypothetical protein
MKKIGIILAIAIALTFVGCASSGGSGGATENLPPYTIELSSFEFVKNAAPFTKKYDDLIIPFPEFSVDITKYSRVTITCKYYGADGVELAQGDTKAMVTLAYDPKGDIRGPEMGPGKNTPLKEMNVGGYSGLVNTDKGVRVRLTQAPGIILFQNSDDAVKYIELTGITFHTKTASGE